MKSHRTIFCIGSVCLHHDQHPQPIGICATTHVTTSSKWNARSPHCHFLYGHIRPRIAPARLYAHLMIRCTALIDSGASVCVHRPIIVEAHTFGFLEGYSFRSCIPACNLTAPPLIQTHPSAICEHLVITSQAPAASSAGTIILQKPMHPAIPAHGARDGLILLHAGLVQLQPKVQ